MLQPRKRKFTLKIEPKGLLLCVIILLTFTYSLKLAKGEDEKHGLIRDQIKRGDRVIRHGDVNIVILDDFDRRKITPSLGLLSTTARTFIQEGTTTEYATHIFGTTLNDKYAHIVSTGSKIFYDHSRPSKKENTDSIISVPFLDALFEVSEENTIIPSKVMREKNAEKLSSNHGLHIVSQNREDVTNKNAKSLKANIPSVTEETPMTLNGSTSSEHKKYLDKLSMGKEIFIKPAKVKQKNELPTFTIKQDSLEFESSANQIQNSEFEVDNAVKAHKLDQFNLYEKIPEITTTTYFGFADFTTTTGNTVIVFTPKTKKPNFEASVTVINGEPTLSTLSKHPNTQSIFPTKVSSIPSVISTPSEVFSNGTNTNINPIEDNKNTESYTESDVITTEKEESNDHSEFLSQQGEQVDTLTDFEDYSTEAITETDANNMIATTTEVESLVKHKNVPLLNNYNSSEFAISNNNSSTPATELFTTYLTTFFLPASTTTPKENSPKSETTATSSKMSIPVTTDIVDDITTQSSTTETEDIVTELNEINTSHPDSTPEKIVMENSTPTTSESYKPEEEVDLVFKTLYTTYTYLTTYFEKSTTRVNSREEVATNIVTSTLDSAFIQQATDPVIVSLFSGHRQGKLLPTSTGLGRPTSTFLSNIKPKDEDISSSSIHFIGNDLNKPTPSLTLYSGLAESKMALHSIPIAAKENLTAFHTALSTPTTEWDHPVRSKLPFAIRNNGRIPFRSVILKHRLFNANKTIVDQIKHSRTEPSNEVTIHKLLHTTFNSSTEKIPANKIVSEEISVNSIISAPLISTKENILKGSKELFLKNDSDDDQLSQESNTEETGPSQSLISLETSYTTYTYFTTIYKNSSSDIISHLETVTNVNTDLLKPTKNLPPTVESTSPVTYYTTYTYWTSFYKDGSAMIKSRQETISAISPTVPSIASSIRPSASASSALFTRPITYYTTFTYFTTSYTGDNSVINSHLETVTNIINATDTIISSSTNKSSAVQYPIFQSTGLVFSNISTHVADNIATLFTTKTFGTYNNGLYSENIETTASIISNPIRNDSIENLISLEEGRVIDGFKIFTTFYTTKVIGTYIQQLYAQLIESTSSIKINTESSTNLLKPSTIIVDNKTYQTGILQLREGSIIKYGTTTHYKTEIIGTIIEGQYKSITETSSSINFKNISPTMVHIKPTVVADISSNIQPTQLSSISPSLQVVQSSIDTSDEEEDEGNTKEKVNKQKSFTPVIRPFASRSRPIFLPKKKSSDILSAATITRGITPTIVAIPAIKTFETRGFSSSYKNRFGNGQKTSSNVQVTDAVTSSGTKRFIRTRSSSFEPFYLSTSAATQANHKIQTSITPSIRRGNLKASTSKSFDYLSHSTLGSQFKVHPTASRKVNYLTTQKLEEEAILEQASFPEEEIMETAPPPISIPTESNSKSNPLLRFKKPASQRSVTVPITTIKPTIKKVLASRKTDRKLTTIKTPTTKSTNTRTINYNNNNRIRLKPSNSLLLHSNLNKQDHDAEISTEISEIPTESPVISELVTEALTEKSTRGGKNINIVPIKPFSRRTRVKRQAEYGYKYENMRSQSRYRQLSMQGSYPDYLYYDDSDYTTEDTNMRNHLNRNIYSKSRPSLSMQHIHQQYPTTPMQQASPKIRPSTASSPRSPFTIREKSHASSQTTTAPQRSNWRTTRKYENINVTKKPPRQRTYTTTLETPSYRNNRKQSSTRRTSTRSRYKDEYNLNSYLQPINDGTITVTYKIPTEVTIPIVSGKVTEYKNVVTAKPSIQILAPHQYNTITGKNGLNTLQLVAENTETMLNGIVEVTKYVIQEFPTSSITFTPTTIRGRKTSFSHIVPSTVYEIKSEVSTIPPQLNGNAPLANLLLSQLLLGNLGFQQTINPLLGLNQGVSASPITEYKTKTTSYVTTLTHTSSNVIPITFRGKEIKTTVVDSSIQVITATEYITESVIISPTQSMGAINNNQLQTLLLPAILQAQLLNQAQSSTPNLLIDENGNDYLQSIVDIPSPSKVSNSGPSLDNENLKGKGHKNKGKPVDSPIEPAETSVVTLYLSGRKPGEFSTVLSTVTLDEEKLATLQKRHIDPVLLNDLRPSELYQLSPTASYNEDDPYSVINSGIIDVSILNTNQETQSLESIIGDISNHILTEVESTKTEDVQSKSNIKNLKKPTNHFLLNTSTETAPFQWNYVSSRGTREKRNTKKQTNDSHFYDDAVNSHKLSDISVLNLRSMKNKSKKVEHIQPVLLSVKSLANNRRESSAVGTMYREEKHLSLHNSNPYATAADDEGRGRFNLATKVMSNGVEVIVALDRSTLPGSPQLLRVLPTSNMRPITFTPHTVTDHMIMMLPHGLQDIPNPFVTKTYLTTYTYLTTILERGTITTSSEEKVISNVVTDNIMATQPENVNEDVHITLDSSPIMATKVYQTTYNMESTVRDGNSPHIIVNQQTVSNTFTAPDNLVILLQPSEPSFNAVQAGSSTDNVNEELFIKPTKKLSLNIHTESNDDNAEVKSTSLQAADITKTYFVTYTYFSTLLENGSTVIKSNVATSSDVVTEKHYMPLRRTKYPSSSDMETYPTPNANVLESTLQKTFHIFATKTYLTTYTYFTTLLQDKDSKPTQTVIRSRTKVVQNLVTETLNPNLLNVDYLMTLKNSLRNDPSLPITTTATLYDGQKLEITALNDNLITTPLIDKLYSSEENHELYNHISGSETDQRLNNTKNSEIGSNQPNGSNTITTSILHSSTIMKNGATYIPGSPVIKFPNSAGNPDSIHNINEPIEKIQMNNLLNFGNLGVGSLNALKPVLNAMAGLWQNNVKSNVKNKSEYHAKPIEPYLESNQLELNTLLKPPNRTPIYIPVGSILQEDNEEAGSEDFIEQYPDINQRNHIPISNAAMEKPLVSGGGIPISPGQVITANTDVIVGTPAVLGPRPQMNNNNEKSDVIGMKPPPIGQKITTFGNQNSERVVSNGYKIEDNVKVPSKPLSPAFLNSGFSFPNYGKHPGKVNYKLNIDQKIPMSSEIRFSQLPLHAPLTHVKDYIKNYTVKDSITSNFEVQENYPLSEVSSLNPLLIDVHPSEVAQVVIPHNGQNALVYNNQPSFHNTKGEISNDPSLYLEQNVNPGFVDLKVFGPANINGASKQPPTTLHLDIPIDPYIDDGTITESHHFITLNLESQPQSPYNVLSPILKASEEGINFKRPNSKYNFTISNQNDQNEKNQHYYSVWQPPEMDQNQQRPYKFPQYKPLMTEYSLSSTTESNIKDYSNGGSDIDNDSVDYNDSGFSSKDGLIQETELKPSSNPQPEVSHTKVNESSDELNLDYEFNQNWDILKEKLTKTNKTQNKVENNILVYATQDQNSTTKEPVGSKYNGWSTIELPAHSSNNEININNTDKAAAVSSSNKDSIMELKKDNMMHETTASPNHNKQNDIVIGLSPPPFPTISHPTTVKLTGPSNPKLPHRPTLKTKQKPTSHPYPFEKPNPSSINISRPKPTIISKPPPNILYETDPPNFADELLKLKALNATGKIEPIKKWQSTTKSNLGPAVFGNIEKVQELERKNETKSSILSNVKKHNSTMKVPSDTKFIVVEKPDRDMADKTTELISKWNEEGIIFSSKIDYEENEFGQNTPALDVNKTRLGANANTIFGNLYTRPPPANIVIIPTHSTTQHHTAISMVIDHSEKPDERDSGASFTLDLKPAGTVSSHNYPITHSKEQQKPQDEHNAILIPTYYITHTKTTSVTITQTTVLHKNGHPSTHTIVQTKTQTTTLIDTVTKIQTLLQPTSVLSTITTTVPITVSNVAEIHPPIATATSVYNPSENDSIFVVMSDKKTSTGGTGHVVPASAETRPTAFDVQVPDEANEISPNDILFSGIFTQHSDNECRPECKVTKNEMCQKIDNNMRCVCRPGFARMFPDHPCKPTYSYIMRMPLDRQGVDEIHYTEGLADRTSPSHQQLTEAARDGLDRMVMQSNLRDIYHGVVVSGFEPTTKSDRAAVVYVVQLSENAEQTKLQDEIHKTLKASNFSLGGTDVFAAPDPLHAVQAEDFDECTSNKYHDCSDNAQCFNVAGTYTCSCKEGFADMSYNTEFPGRICSADAIGCELCNYHGTCYYKSDEEPTCECFQWYAGEFCQINLKVTLITLITIGVLLGMLLIACLIMTCSKQKPPEILRAAPKPHVGFRRYRSVNNLPGDKRAIVSVDTSSEGSIERTPPPFVKQRVLRNEAAMPPMPTSLHSGHVSCGEPKPTTERDRSLTVLIPRAKYRPGPSQSSSALLTMSTFGPEQKLLNCTACRESCRMPEKVSRCSMHSRKLSNSTNLSAELVSRKKSSAPTRPSSGALVSAGFEVSTTVRRTQELDEAYVNQAHIDLNQPTYNSIRTAESSVVVDVPTLPVFESSLEDFIARVNKLGTVSEARSYDETTIQPPMRSLHHLFHSRTHTCDSKHSSSQKDEHHTMGERDLGSTYMPKSQLYKPDYRESDGSNFDSL